MTKIFSTILLIALVVLAGTARPTAAQARTVCCWARWA